MRRGEGQEEMALASWTVVQRHTYISGEMEQRESGRGAAHEVGEFPFFGADRELLSFEPTATGRMRSIVNMKFV